MTGICSEDIWVTNNTGGGSEGQTVTGAVATGVVGGLIEGGRRLFGGSAPKTETYERQQRRLAYEAELENRRYAAEQSEKVKRREILFRRNANRITTERWRMQEIKKNNSTDGNPPRRVFEKTHIFTQELSHYTGKEALLKEMHEQQNDPHFAIKLSSLKWRSPAGDLNDHGLIDPEKINLGWGGDYDFNMVWDESLPFHYRSPMAHLHRRLAEIYVVPADEAAMYVINEYINPGSEAGLKRFRQANCVPKHDTSVVTGHEHNRIAEYSILNMMAAELEQLHKRGPTGSLDTPYQSPDDVLAEVAKHIRIRQRHREEVVYKSAYLSTRGTILTKAKGLMKRTIFSMEQAMDDFNFGHEQYINISDACAREDNARLWACAQSVSGDASLAVEDKSVEAGTLAALGSLNVKTGVAMIVNGTHRIIKAGRQSPACRDALKQYRERACMNRVLPRGAVRVDGYPGNLYVRPDNDETSSNSVASNRTGSR